MIKFSFYFSYTGNHKTIPLTPTSFGFSIFLPKTTMQMKLRKFNKCACLTMEKYWFWHILFRLKFNFFAKYSIHMAKT